LEKLADDALIEKAAIRLRKYRHSKAEDVIEKYGLKILPWCAWRLRQT
jgi:hypothetical protein